MSIDYFQNSIAVSDFWHRYLEKSTDVESPAVQRVYVNKKY